MTSTPLEHTRKTGRDQAHFTVRAVTVCHVFFSRLRSRLPYWSYSVKMGSSVDTQENLQPVQYVNSCETPPATPQADVPLVTAAYDAVRIDQRLRGCGIAPERGGRSSTTKTAPSALAAPLTRYII